MKTPRKLSEWLSASYPEYPHAYFGLSGWTMLFDVLRAVRRSTVLVPGFMCAELPLMVVRAGKRVVHVDADRRTLHMDMARLEELVSASDSSDTCLLFDHTFGYPCAAIEDIRARYPKLLIIEDCARALGAEIDGVTVGHHGDVVLLSMYKATPGSSHGAILLSREPRIIRGGPVAGISARQICSQMTLFRIFYERLKRRHPDYGDTPRAVKGDREWTEKRGFPNAVTLGRFTAQVMQLKENRKYLRGIFDQVTGCLADIPGIVPVDRDSRGGVAAHFVSFTLDGRIPRNAMLTALHRQGLFLMRTWDLVPAFLPSLAQTFPYGFAGSVFLADHVIHVPVRRFVRASERDRLTKAIRAFLRSA